MKIEELRPAEAATIEQGCDTPKITYGDLLDHVRERRKAELQKDHPGRPSNLNAVSNTTRSLTVFMEANGLCDVDAVGDELIGTTAWDKAFQALGADNTAKRRKAEMNARVRPWAMEMIRAAVVIYDDDSFEEFGEESFGERLRRLRHARGMTARSLAMAVSGNGNKISDKAIRTWETQERKPSSEKRELVARIERVLGVSPGKLEGLLPASSYQLVSIDTGLPRSVQRRVAAHLPDDFESRPLREKDEILEWISENILSTPKEVLEDGKVSLPKGGMNLSAYVLARDPSLRLKSAPKHLIEEIDLIREFKTADFSPDGYNRNTKWGTSIADRSDYEIRAFFGALHEMGMPEASMSLSAILCPGLIQRFIEWKRERRGGYTRSVEITLQLMESLLHPEFGFIAQTPGFGVPLVPVRGLISKTDVQRVQASWGEACAHSRETIKKRLKELTKLMTKGRDPFEAILPVLDAPSPLREYYNIVYEIRERMPDGAYPVRRAEALRDLMMMRLGLELALRQKNNRELLICPPGKKPRSWKELARKEQAEMSFDNEAGWVVRIPKSAFKNADSNQIDAENTFPLRDRDGLYDEIAEYLEFRPCLLKGHEDPGTFFVKTMSRRSTSAQYDQNGYYNAFRSAVTTYGIFNPFTGRGAIHGLRPHGPHSLRHIMATELVSRTGGYSEAAGLLLDSEEMIRRTYAKWGSEDRHTKSRDFVWSNDMFDKGDAA